VPVLRRQCNSSRCYLAGLPTRYAATFTIVRARGTAKTIGSADGPRGTIVARTLTIARARLMIKKLAEPAVTSLYRRVTGKRTTPTVRRVAAHIRASSRTSRPARVAACSAGTIVRHALIAVRATATSLRHTGASTTWTVFSRSAGNQGRDVAGAIAASSCGSVAQVVAAAGRLPACINGGSAGVAALTSTWTSGISRRACRVT